MHDLIRRLVNPMGGPQERALRAAVSGKNVLVTGASFGIGRATAKRLAAAGANVILLARSGGELRAVADEIAASGGVAHAYALDLTGPNVTETARVILEAHGPMDVIVNNAGKSIRRSLALSYDRFHDFTRTMGTNYLGPVQLLLALLPSMRARGRGHVVNVSTIGVRVPPGPRWGAYQASKTAFDVWLRSVTPEILADRVTVSTIYMALVHTRMSAPTTFFRQLPGLSPEEAAELVCRAIVEKNSTIAPWWVSPAELLGYAARRPIARALGIAYRLTSDSTSARGEGVRKAAPALGARVTLAVRAVAALTRAGVVVPAGPRRLRRAASALRMGASPASASAVAAAIDPSGRAILDERGAVTYAELEDRVRAIASGLAARFGVGPGRAVALMCRNHRGFVETVLAAARLGADLVLLNTDFPGPQLRQALAHHDVSLAVHDAEFARAFEDSGFAGPRVLAWHDDDVRGETLDALAAGPRTALPAARRPGKIVILTSGTTGAPKGAPRAPSVAAFAGPLTTILTRVPLATGEPILIAPPLFHGFGLAYLGLALVVRAPIVLRRRFDATQFLATVAEHRVRAALVVPVMLKRVLDLVPEVRARHDTSSLRAVLSGGAPLGARLASDFMDAFGEVVFNLYGSSEVGFAAMANPADLRAAPGTVGYPPLGATVRVLDEARREVPSGVVGSVFVGGPLAFDGYSGGGGKEKAEGLLNTGDLGHLDESGRLFIDGRDDDMIVSGGENVFPKEVEELLLRHDAVADAAVLGVRDAEFGQRLRAFVVTRAGAHVTSEDVVAYVRAHVARFKVPRDIVFVDELPRNATGKLDKRKLPAASDDQEATGALENG